MDLAWKTAAWDWDRSAAEKDNGKREKAPLFRYHADRVAYGVQVSRAIGCATPRLNKHVHSTILRAEKDWHDWLETVPQPESSRTVHAALSLLIFPRHPDPKLSTEIIRDPAILKQVPVPSEHIFRRAVETLHIHQATKTIINRGWPIILKIEDSSSPDRKLYYNLRCSNTLGSDTALAMTVIPSKRLVYAILFGYADKQVNTILERLAFAEYAVLEPFTLINAFIQLEKVHRFEQVEEQVDDMAHMIENFQHDVAVRRMSRGKVSSPVHEDDPRDLVGLATDVTLLKNGLVSWARELERFREKTVEDFEITIGGDPRLPLQNAPEYLERTVDEYGAMVRKCEGMLSQVSMTFQMETSSIARQEVNKMKALAILTMFFLPATFAATFMSMGLFNWRPKEDENVLSPWWWVYFIIAGGLTAIVFLLYFCWSRLTESWFRRRERTDRHLV